VITPALVLGALLSASPALAGGIGLIGTGGTHEDFVYYYGSNGVQGIDVQTRPNFGGGLEIYVGDQDARMLGAARLLYLSDAAQAEPEIDSRVPGPITMPALKESRDLGIATVGLYWGLLGDPTRLQLDLSSFIGACAFTADDTEFAIAELGIGGHYQFHDHMQVFLNVSGTARYRKLFYFGGNAYGGVRYLFD
jgi:hypothetical protein